MATPAGIEGEPNVRARGNPAPADVPTPYNAGDPPPAERVTPRPDVVDRPLDHALDLTMAALGRELARAREERRWVDVDALARELDERRKVLNVSNVVPLRRTRR